MLDRKRSSKGVEDWVTSNNIACKDIELSVWLVWSVQLGMETLPGPDIKIQASHCLNNNLQAFTSYC